MTPNVVNTGQTEFMFSPSFALAPAETQIVRGEWLCLNAVAPRGYAQGTRLRALQTIAPGVGTTAKGSLNSRSIVVRVGTRVLSEGRDYLIDHEWGTLGLAPRSSVTSDEFVEVDYEFSLLRLDSLVRTAAGNEAIRRGVSHLTAPRPPELKAGEIRLANFFVSYGCDGSNAERFPILKAAQEATTFSTPHRIPQTLAKLEAGEPVKIVCWGDSVTAGGDASAPEFQFPAVFERRLKAAFPLAPIEVETIAISGSQSRQWLDSVAYPFPTPEKQEQGCFERIAEARPDLVTVEFVNDASIAVAELETLYTEIVRRIRALGAEVILITPHFTSPEMMAFATLREAESRPYVRVVHELSEAHGVALADASSRWAHLWREGLPYITLLQNGINHPDDRGHALFADELMKCCAPRPLKANME